MEEKPERDDSWSERLREFGEQFAARHDGLDREYVWYRLGCQMLETTPMSRETFRKKYALLKLESPDIVRIPFCLGCERLRGERDFDTEAAAIFGADRIELFEQKGDRALFGGVEIDHPPKVVVSEEPVEDGGGLLAHAALA